MSKSIVVCLAEGFEDIEAVTVIDVLRRAELDVTVAGVGGIEIIGARGINVAAECEIGEVEGIPDAVVLPGGMPGSVNLGKSKEVAELVKNTNASGKICAAICAAPAMALAAFGVLDGKNATCYPGCESEFPASVKYCEDAVVVDDNIVTSRAPATAMAFSLKLVEMLVDRSKAEELAVGMLFTQDF